MVGCLHTESGRTERYRHYMRHKTPLNEQQLAIMTELMLRGKQQLGELRTRASRMVAIDSQEELRRELQALMATGLVRSNGPLERRGIEVDHDLYPRGENYEPLSEYQADESDSVPIKSQVAVSTVRQPSEENVSEGGNRIASLESTVRELQREIEAVRHDFRELQGRFEDLRSQLGG